MKTFKFLNLALALSLVSFAAVSCGDDDSPKIPTDDPDAKQEVVGKYTGTMTLTPAGGTAMTPETTAFEIKDGKIVFESFPLTSLVSVIYPDLDAAAVAAFVAAIGDIAYDMPFDAVFNTDKTEVALTLKPGAFEIKQTEPKEITIKVTITAPSAGKYVAGTKKLTYSLSVDKVLLNGVDTKLPVMTLAFAADDKPAEPTAKDVVAGEYTGTMILTQAGEEAMSPETAAFEIKDGKIVFESFPLTSIVKAILDLDDAAAAAFVAAIGDIAYDIPFDAAFNTDKTEVTLTLKPGAFEIKLDDPTADPPVEIKINVTITAPSAGKYVAGTKKLTYTLSVDKVEMNDNDMGLPVMTLAFDATKK